MIIDSIARHPSICGLSFSLLNGECATGSGILKVSLAYSVNRLYWIILAVGALSCTWWKSRDQPQLGFCEFLTSLSGL